MDASTILQLEGHDERNDPRYPFNRIAQRLYIAHALSTWNSRMFEFGAVLFLAEIFPGTLFYASFYALGRALFAAILSSWVGAQMDSAHRLKAIRHSISEFSLVGKVDAFSFWD